MFLQAFGNTPEVMEQEYGHYQGRSRFVTVIDEEGGSALGVARLILPDATAPVKTLVDVAGEPWHLDVVNSLRAAGLSSRPVWDVASLAVDRRFRSGAAGAEVIVALCHGVHQYSLNCGVEGLVTVLDDRILRVVRAMGMPWTPMAGATSQYYLGSPASTPCVMVMSSVAESIRTRRPDLAPAVIDGIFRSIVLDPADLLPGRGGSLPRVPPCDQPDRPPVGRDRSAWKPPTHRRTGTLVSSPDPST
ncbi:hypothetical protein SAMN06272737_12637 [Blastococcus mobilis]|uniref:Uncharacterized protein n=1 Tax=Blastococcus mobilis TaxID=1938746 RepID=A0A238Z998_9ACTN|nr:hypothetical protein SAMN06272737_12637 [Blastococcus mobilis]